MKFECDRKLIQQIASEYSYTATNVEKVIRLCIILEDLNTIEGFKCNLLLKGGTAINLIAFKNLARLSVDLDLDFARLLSKEETLDAREKIDKALSEYFENMGYHISDRRNFALDSKSLHYETVTGSLDKIKLDINYHSRCHVYPFVVSEVKLPFKQLDKHIKVAHLNIIELFAGKIKAMYERCKPRDIFDIFTLAESGLLSTKAERDALRKCTVFYSILGNASRQDLLRQDLNEIRKMPFQAFKTQLFPMLHTKMGHFYKDKLLDVAIDYLDNLMKLERQECEFIELFFKGDFRPELLFDEVISNNLKQHPVILSTLQSIKQGV